MPRLLWISLVLQVSVFTAAQTTDASTWQVKLADGSDTKLMVSNKSGVIEFRNGQAIAFAIPAHSITDILHSTQRIRRSTKAYNRLESMCCGATDSHLLSLLAMAVVAPFGSAKEHYIEVRWYRNGDGMVVLEPGKDDYLPFMNWLQEQSGTKWRDIDQERDQALKAIEERGPAAFSVPIIFRQGNGTDLILRYSVLPIDDRDSTDLYFFNGAVKPKNLIAIMPVTREWSANTCVFDVKVLYGTCRDEHCDIEAILLPTLTYRAAKPKVIVTNAPGDSETACTQVIKQERQWGKRAGEDNRPTLKRRDE